MTAAVTVGTAALVAPLRNPVLAAHALASVDQLSEGRLVVGVGAGFPSQETRRGFDVRAYYRRPHEEMATFQVYRAGPAAEVGDRLRGYVTAGARHLVPRLGSFDPTGRSSSSPTRCYRRCARSRCPPGSR